MCNVLSLEHHVLHILIDDPINICFIISSAVRTYARMVRVSEVCQIEREKRSKFCALVSLPSSFLLVIFISEHSHNIIHLFASKISSTTQLFFLLFFALFYCSFVLCVKARRNSIKSSDSNSMYIIYDIPLVPFDLNHCRTLNQQNVSLKGIMKCFIFTSHTHTQTYQQTNINDEEEEKEKHFRATINNSSPLLSCFPLRKSVHKRRVYHDREK